MDRRDIANTRIINQRLAGHSFSNPVETVRWFGAIQAQEYPYAKWGLGQRAPSQTDALVEQALAEGRILRAHAMRPTWHFADAADIRWLQELTGPRVHAVNRSLYRNNELDGALLSSARRLLIRALRDGNYLTRQELATKLREGGIDASGQRLAYIMMHNELDAVVCSGPRRGKQHTYALVAERAPQATGLPREEALAELTRRYFRSHGPATLKDFVWWSGLTTSDARSGIALLGVEVERFDLSGVTLFHIPFGICAPAATPEARLLQAYDEYIVAYTESRHVLNIDGLVATMPAGRPLYMHALVIDGQLAGHWRRYDRAGSATIAIVLARPLSPAERVALDAEVARYAEFSGVPVELDGVD